MSTFRFSLFSVLCLPAIFFFALMPSCSHAQTAYTLDTGSRFKDGFWTSTNAGSIVFGLESNNLLSSYSASLWTATDASAFRFQLGLGNSAVLNVGTTSGTVAAGDDTRIVNAVQKSPPSGTFRIKNGNEFQLYDTSLNKWRSIWFDDGFLQFGVAED